MEDPSRSLRGDLDRVERRFWRDIWSSAPRAAEHGLELRTFGPVQATVATGMPERLMMNLVLGAAEQRAVSGGYLGAALTWAAGRGARACVPVTPGAPEAEAAESWLTAHGYERAHGWMKFLRDAHAPRFERPPGIEVVELAEPDQAPFGTIAAIGFGLPAWTSSLFAGLVGMPGWRCYVARVAGEPQAGAAMLVDDDIAEFGVAATLKGARGRGCQLALLRRRIVDAAEAGCRTLFVETGERVPDRPSTSYRNILRAGFKEAYARPNWQRPKG